MDGFSEYDQYDGLGLADLVDKKEISPAELVEEAISRIERVNPKINAVIHKMYDQARRRAMDGLPDGPFKGVPFLLKDLMSAYQGEPLRGGSKFFNEYIPDHDSELVKRYKAAGLVVVGKTNTPELGLVPVTEPELFGPTRNPWDLNRTSGGSSGGSAASVAARIVPMAHGGDGGGSIRIPASCCGVFGLKPTRGRTPAGPDRGESWLGMAIEHVLTRSVRDCAVMLDATSGPDIGAPYYAAPPKRAFLSEIGETPGKLRIAFTSKPILPGKVHPDCVKGLDVTVRLLEELGHELEEDAPEIDGHAMAHAFFSTVCVETRADIEEGQALVGKKPAYNEFEPVTWVVGLLGKQISGVEYARANRLLKLMSRRIGQFFESYDLLLTPTLSEPPLIHGALQPKPADAAAMKLLGPLNAGGIINMVAGVHAQADQVFAFIPYTPPFNITGQPAMSVPLYWNDQGLPIGMHFIGRFGDEATLFRLASQLEQASPWFDKKPPVSA